MNKLHALFLWFLFPGVILGWLMTIFTFFVAEFIVEEMWPIFKRDMKQYTDGVKMKWSEK